MSKVMTQDELQEILIATAKYPSADNCQPFQFEWDGDGKLLRIFHDSQRAKHYFNYKNLASIFTLGLLLENLAIAAAAKQFEVQYSLYLEDKETYENRPWAEVEFQHNAELSRDDLVDAIPDRATDRRPYQGGDFEHPVYAKVLEDARHAPNTNLYFKGKEYPKEIIKYVTKMETYIFQTKAAHQDIFGWMRFEQNQIEKTRDGMPWPTLGINYMESRALKLARNYPVQASMNAMGGLLQVKKLAKDLLKSSSGLGCLTVSSLEKEDLVNAGRLVERAWLHFTQNGFGFQPLSTNAFLLYCLSIDPQSQYFNPKYARLLGVGPQVLRDFFQIPEGEYPCWFFRTGIVSSKLEPKMRTLRLPLAELWKKED